MKTSGNRSAIAVKTKHGQFILEAGPKGLYRLSFPRKRLSSAAGAGIPNRALKKAAGELKKYLEGKSSDLQALRVDYSDYTDSEVLVLKALAKVKAGEFVSYEGLSRRAGFKRAARFVGSVMSKNRLPIFLPCHRVVCSDGGLGGYSLGLSWKKRLLALEKPEPKKAS